MLRENSVIQTTNNCGAGSCVSSVGFRFRMQQRPNLVHTSRRDPDPQAVRAGSTRRVASLVSFALAASILMRGRMTLTYGVQSLSTLACLLPTLSPCIS